MSFTNTFEYQPVKFRNQSVTYPYSLEFSIANMTLQFKSRDVQISITENNKIVDWTKYSAVNQNIKIANYPTDIEGIHSLVVSVYDYCYSKSFKEVITVRILPNYPPAVVGTIDEVIGYQGQSIILQRDVHLDVLFHDPFDEVDFVMLG